MTSEDSSNGVQEIRIFLENLAVVKDSSRLPLSQLDVYTHIHGGLRVQIGGRFMPYLGYWSPDDVCLGAWMNELRDIYLAFDGKATAVYVYDEGEQGQPAFRFEKDGDVVYLSIVDSELSDGQSHPEWQRIAFSYEAFREQYLAVEASFLREVRHAAPEGAARWLAWAFPNPIQLLP